MTGRAYQDFFKTMSKTLVSLIIVVVLIVLAIVGLSRIDSTKQPKRVEIPVPENALAQ